VKRRWQRSYVEVTLKSGAVVAFPCTSISYSDTGLSMRIAWVQDDDEKVRATRIDPGEVAAIVFYEKER
jgi:hypothetical protein